MDAPCFDVSNFHSYIDQLCQPNGVYRKLFLTKYLIFKYGINKIEDTILKNNIILAKDKGLKLNITKIIRGTCNDMLAQRDFPKIKSLDINLKDIYNKIVNNYNLDLSDQCDFDFQNIGYIESPNKKNLISEYIVFIYLITEIKSLTKLLKSFI